MARYVEADRTFHDTISRLSDDSALLEMLDTLRPRVRRFIRWGRANLPPAGWADHSDIMAALRANDADGVALVISSHVLRAGELLVAHVEAPPGGLDRTSDGRHPAGPGDGVDGTRELPR